jgi:hypothetical protein
VRDTYVRINTLDFFVRAIQYETRVSGEPRQQQELFYEDVQIHRLFLGIPHYDNPHYYNILNFRGDVEQPYDFESLSTIAVRYTGPLHIHGISFASHDWVDLLGNLNPLKVIADAIAEWRRQNIERERNLMNAETERLKIRTGFAMEVLRSYESAADGNPNGYNRMAEIEQKVIRPAEEFIDRIAGDRRILAIRVLDDRMPSEERARGRHSRHR